MFCKPKPPFLIPVIFQHRYSEVPIDIPNVFFTFFSFHKPDDDYINDPFLLTFRSWHDICFTNASTHVFPMIWYILMLIYMDFFSSNLHCNPKMCTLFSWCEFVFLKTPTFYLGSPSPTRPAPPHLYLHPTSIWDFRVQFRSENKIFTIDQS